MFNKSNDFLLFLSHAIFREISKEMDVKNCQENVIAKTNRQQFFIVCTPINHSNDVKTLQ